MHPFIKKIRAIFFGFCIFSSFPAIFASETLGTVNAENYTSHFLRLPEIGKIGTSSQDIYWNTPAPHHVQISDTSLKGYLWGPLVGYINLSCENTNSCMSSNFHVINTNGILSGYAWGENTGWISFSCANQETNNCALNNNAKVVINDNGEFSGYAWSQNFGWILFDCSSPSSCVKTDWRKSSLRTPLITTNNNQISGGGAFISTSEKIDSNTIHTNSSLLSKKAKEESLIKPSLQKKESPHGEKTQQELKQDSPCTEAVCSGISPFMFPFSTIAPNGSQIKQLRHEGSSFTQSPELVISQNTNNSGGLLTSFSKLSSFTVKVKNFFESLFSSDSDNEITTTENQTALPNTIGDKTIIKTISRWLSSLFHI